MIYLSAGHYSGRGGVRYGRITEFDVTRQITAAVFGKLDYSDVMLVPSGPLRGKVDWINNHGARSRDLAIEIHLNAWAGYRSEAPPGPESPPRGPECWIHRNAEQRTADAAREIVLSLESYWFWNRSPNVKRSAGLYFLRATKCPAIIVEIEFIHTAAYCLAEVSPIADNLAASIVQAHEIIIAAPISA